MTTDYGYQLPTVINPPHTKCFVIHVPDDLYHIAAFKGQIWELTRWFNWAKDVDHLALQVAEVWKGIYNAMQTEDCCDCPPRIRLNHGIIQWQDSDGNWHDTEDGDERTSGTAIPPYPDNPDGACLAAANITAIYQTALTQLRAGVVASEVAVAIAATITGIMGIFIAPAIVSTIALAITGMALDAGEAALDTMLEQSHLDNFQCSVYCHTESDGSVTASGFTGMREAMANWATGVELALIQFWLDGFGSVGLTRQGAAGGITTADCSACDCAGDWCLDIDFTVTDGGCISPPIIVHPAGVWASGSGWESTDAVYQNSSDIVRWVQRRYELGGMYNVTKAKITYNYVRGANTIDGNQEASVGYAGSYTTRELPNTGNANGKTLERVANALTDAIDFSVTPDYGRDTVILSGTGTVTHLHIEGRDVIKPAGAVSC
jgi:hypothetical protein